MNRSTKRKLANALSTVDEYLESKGELKTQTYKEKAVTALHLLEDDYKDDSILNTHFQHSCLNIDDSDEVFMATKFLMKLETRPYKSKTHKMPNKYCATTISGDVIAESSSLYSLYDLIKPWLIRNDFNEHNVKKFTRNFKEKNGMFKWGKVDLIENS